MFLGRFPITEAETQIAPYHVVWRVYPQLDLIQMSGLLSGMAALEARNAVSTSIEFMSELIESSYAAMEFVVTETRTGQIRNIAFDFYDRADRFASRALRFSDIYFKRQFGDETRSATTGGRTDKIAPLGLTIAGYSSGALRHVCLGILASLRSARKRDTRGLLRRAYEEARLWTALPRPDAARFRETDVKRSQIVFQPRVWPTTPGSRDQFDVANEDRIATVRALRRAFPDHPSIGLLRTDTAFQLAPELVLTEKVTTATYHRQLREARVAVNCIGLSGSVGWKFAEYLAAGNAIVSQPITHRFLAPITEGEHYLTYNSPEECVDLCRRLMADDALSSRMRDVNRQYFMDWVNPPAHLSHLLTRAFAV